VPLPLNQIRERLLRRPPRLLDADDEWRRAAVAAVFRDGADGAELLFIQRTEFDGDPWSGQIAFPGGRAEPEDASLVHTASRETAEEIGLDLDGADLLGPLDELQARARQKIQPMAIRPHAFAWERGEVAFVPDPTEVADAFWMPLRHLADPAHRVWYDGARAGAPLQFPAVEIGRSRPLWGLTHRMVFEILERLELVDSADRQTMPRVR
jgi:8-oxo-dGTP pyrophosphatase MutT (NUDIX family)